MLTALTSGIIHHTGVLTFNDFALLLEDCSDFSEPTPIAGDLVGRVLYEMGRLKVGQTKSVQIGYRRF
jgi:hypothetical protein